MVTLVLSLVLGYFGRAWLKAYRDSQPPTLRELAQLAKRHGIPMPPKEAKLVLASCEIDLWREENGYSPGFLLAEQRDGETVVLRGFEQQALYSRTGSAPASREFTADQAIAASAGFQLARSNSAALLCAVQLAERGDEVRAAAIIKRAAAQGLSDCPLPPATGNLPDLREFVRYSAFLHMEKRLQFEREAWPEVRVRMAALLEESPALRRDKATVLRDLAAAVDAPPPQPGTIEALLLEWSRAGNMLQVMSPDQHTRLKQAIVGRGFDAVTELIRLRDDRRLTAHVISQSEHGGREFERVGALADKLLREISGVRRDDHVSVDLPDELDELDAATWQNWWVQARAQGEREYCIRNLLTTDLQVREGAMQILLHKHPETLRHVGRDYLQVPPERMASPQLASILARAFEVPRPAKAELLTGLAEYGSAADRLGVLQVLAQLDATHSVESLIEIFEKVTVDTARRELRPASGNYLFVVLQWNDDRLTRAYLNAARRNSVLRMELLCYAAYSFSTASELPICLALMAPFLDDEALIDRSPEFLHFFSDEFTHIAVRDLAALQLAKALKLKARPQPDWTPEQWSALRGQVRDRLQQEKLPALE
jgi:hypothetical protein